MAKALGRRPGPGTIVRSTWRQAGRLIIHEHDHDGGAYVLVTGSVPCYRVAGWIRGVDAKTARFWANGDGRGGYFVPQSELHPWGHAQ